MKGAPRKEGWYKSLWRFLSRIVSEFQKDQCALHAAALSYYALFSLFPLLLLLIVVLSLFIDSPDAQQVILSRADAIFPERFQIFIQKEIGNVIRNRGSVSFVSFLTLIWSSSKLFLTLDTAISRVWDVEEKPSHVVMSYFVNRLLSMIMVLVIAVLAVVSVIAVSVLRILQNRLSSSPIANILGGGLFLHIVNILVYIALFAGVLMLLYRLLPHGKARFGDVWPGAIITALLWEPVKQVFAFYLTSFTNYSAVYGSVGVVIALTSWTYISALILLLGAEICSEYGRERKERASKSMTRPIVQERIQRRII